MFGCFMCMCAREIDTSCLTTLTPRAFVPFVASAMKRYNRLVCGMAKSERDAFDEKTSQMVAACSGRVDNVDAVIEINITHCDFVLAMTPAATRGFMPSFHYLMMKSDLGEKLSTQQMLGLLRAVIKHNRPAIAFVYVSLSVFHTRTSFNSVVRKAGVCVCVCVVAFLSVTVPTGALYLRKWRVSSKTSCLSRASCHPKTNNSGGTRVPSCWRWCRCCFCRFKPSV